MKKQWSVFLDVDGTIVNYNNVLPESAVIAIRRARQNGHRIFIVTGRSKAEMYDYILDIGFDGYIGGNGNYIEVNDETLLHLALPIEDVERIVDWLDNRGLEYYIEANLGLYGSAGFRERGKDTIRQYVESKGKETDDDFSVEDIFPDMIYGENPIRDDVNKISFILDSYEDYEQAVSYFDTFQVNTWGGKGEKALFGDVAQANINKGTALAFLQNHFDLNRDAMMALGDASVDIPMLEYAGVGIAVASGGDEIKGMADYITNAVDEDGLYKAFETFGLI